jgi:hypothetical protein
VTTKLQKPVFRLTTITTVRDGGKRREVIVGLLPGDLIEFRLKGTQRKILITVDGAFWTAAKLNAEHTKRRKK